jgi:hypothetical protein
VKITTATTNDAKVEGEAVEHRSRDDEPDRVGGHSDHGPDEEPDLRDATLHHAFAGRDARLR